VTRTPWDSDGGVLQPLSTVSSGETVTVRSVSAGSEQDRLGEMGIGAGRRLRVVCAGDTLVCQVGECRIGLCRRLARCILVDCDFGAAAGD
jgi:Fe2+ transport system protein FeoA